eukprot:s23_g9.t1
MMRVLFSNLANEFGHHLVPQVMVKLVASRTGWGWSISSPMPKRTLPLRLHCHHRMGIQLMQPTESGIIVTSRREFTGFMVNVYGDHPQMAASFR